MSKPQLGDIWKSYYTDNRYEDNYYLIGEHLGVYEGVERYACLNINCGTQETFFWFPKGKRKADSGVYEISVKVA